MFPYKYKNPEGERKNETPVKNIINEILNTYCDLGPKLPAKCLYDLNKLKAFIIVKFCNVLFRNLTNQNIKIKINFRKMRN